MNQREIGNDAQSFSLGLKAALRQDPDVILVGEMRDLETISTALTAAETGHLVFATLHTQDTAQTIDRIIDVFPPHQQQQVRVQLSVALQGIVTQQLLPTADGSGRVAACEVLALTPAVRNLIREGKTHQIHSVLQTGGAQGMQSMDAALAQLVRAGKITRELAEQRSSTPEELRRLMGVGGGGVKAAWTMATFTFKAVDLAGVPARGELEAESKQAVTDQLRERGLIVLDINEQKTTLTNLDLFERFQRIKPRGADGHDAPARDDGRVGHVDPAVLPRARGADREREAEGILDQVRQDIEAGISMSDALEKHPDTFDELYIAMTRTGETAGMLEEALERIADQMEKRDSLRRQIRAAMAYPMMIGGFAATVLLALVAFLVPVFEEVFKDFNGKLPDDHPDQRRRCRTS